MYYKELWIGYETFSIIPIPHYDLHQQRLAIYV